MSEFRVYRVIEERIKHRKPTFYIERYRWLLGWNKLTVEHWDEFGSSIYLMDFSSSLDAQKYIETNFMKPEIIHHTIYHIAK